MRCGDASVLIAPAIDFPPPAGENFAALCRKNASCRLWGVLGGVLNLGCDFRFGDPNSRQLMNRPMAATVLRSIDPSPSTAFRIPGVRGCIYRQREHKKDDAAFGLQLNRIQLLARHIHPIASTNNQGQTPNMAQPVNVSFSDDFQDSAENLMGNAQK